MIGVLASAADQEGVDLQFVAVYNKRAAVETLPASATPIFSEKLYSGEALACPNQRLHSLPLNNLASKVCESDRRRCPWCIADHNKLGKAYETTSRSSYSNHDTY